MMMGLLRQEELAAQHSQHHHASSAIPQPQHAAPTMPGQGGSGVGVLNQPPAMSLDAIMREEEVSLSLPLRLSPLLQYYLSGNGHVMADRLLTNLGRKHLQMTGCHHPAPHQSPHVQLVDAGHTGHRLDQIPLQLHEVDVAGDGVEEDEGGVPEQRPGGDHDDADNDQAEHGVQVVFVLPVSQHDHQGRDDDGEAAQGVGQDVQEHPRDVHLMTRHSTSLGTRQLHT